MTPSLGLVSLAACALAAQAQAHVLPARAATPENATPRQPQSSCVRDSYQVVNKTGSQIWPYRQYKSSAITPPELAITSTGHKLAEGGIFLGVETVSFSGENQERPYIITSDGDLVWGGPEGLSSNFRKQRLNGTDVISTWRGTGAAASGKVASHGYGEVHILDSHYDLIDVVCPKIQVTLPPGVDSRCVADVHESSITERNTMLVTVYNLTTTDLTSVGGPTSGWVIDPLAVEVDLQTNETLFVWSPLAHVPLNSTRLPLQGAGTNASNPYDWFHMNSIQLFDDHYYINSRHTWSTYYVDKTGHIEWEINGGTGGDFGSLPVNGTFTWAHDARLHKLDGQLVSTWFADDNMSPTTRVPSVGLGLVLELPPNPKTPPTLWSHLVGRANDPVAFAEGSYQLLENGHALLGYGIAPFIEEFRRDGDGDGDLLWRAQFGAYDGASSYRAFKDVWHATPAAPIDLVIETAAAGDALDECAAGSSLRGFVSWNGVTGPVTYTLQAGPTADDVQCVGTFAKKGFETEFVVPADAKFVRVVASQDGKSAGQGSSRVVEV